jgi:hypothetical protein
VLEERIVVAGEGVPLLGRDVGDALYDVRVDGGMLAGVEQ